MGYRTSRNGLLIVNVALAVTLLVADLVNARPNQQIVSVASNQNSSIVTNGKTTDRNHHINTDSKNHSINRREQSNNKSSCNPNSSYKVMEAPILFIGLKEAELQGLSFGAPATQSYSVCVFDGCTEDQIKEFKRKNKRKEVTFHYNALPDTPGDKPSFKVTYTKFFTQCGTDKSSKSMPKSEKV